MAALYAALVHLRIILKFDSVATTHLEKASAYGEWSVRILSGKTAEVLKAGGI